MLTWSVLLPVAAYRHSQDPDLVCCGNIFLGHFIGASTFWHFAALRYISRAIVSFVSDAESGVVVFLCYNSKVDQYGCGMLASSAWA